MDEMSGLIEKRVGFKEENRLYSELVQRLYRQGPVGIVATLINSLILCYIQWPVISAAVIITWFWGLFLITLIRAIFIYRYHRVSSTIVDAHGWGTWFVIGIGISGIAWGAAGFFLFPGQDIARQVVLAFVLGGMATGATFAFSALKIAFFAYTIPASIPIIIKFFSQNDSIHLAMGVMALLFVILMTVTAMRNHNMLVTSLILRFENKDLVQYLSQAKENAP